MNLEAFDDCNLVIIYHHIATMTATLPAAKFLLPEVGGGPSSSCEGFPHLTLCFYFYVYVYVLNHTVST